jgi:hypothetical protein
MDIGLHEETLDASKKFNERLDNLSSKVDLAIIRLYILTGQKDPTVSDSLYKEAEEIFKLRSSALKVEMKHVAAQAKIAGVLNKVPQDVLDGTSLKIGFRKEVLEILPSLYAYEFFMPYTKEELEKWLQNEKETNIAINKDDIKKKNKIAKEENDDNQK